MNPVLGRIKPTKSQVTMQSLIADVKTGKVDPRQKAIEMLSKLNPLQKARVKAALPMLQRIARRSGATDANINAFLLEVRDNL